MGLVRLILQEPEPLSPLDLHLQSFLLDREGARCSPATLVHYRYTVGSFVGWLREHSVNSPQDIRPDHIRAYLVDLQRRGLKDTSQHAHARGIKTFLRWLVAEGELEKSPMDRVSMPRLDKTIPPPFSRDDIERLLKACASKTPRDLRDKALVLCLLDSGLRASEIVSLTVGDLDMRSGPVTIVGKGRKQRTVRFGSRARQAILRYLATRQDVTPDSPLWVALTKDGRERGALTMRGLEIVCHYLGQRAGVSPANPHRYRRTFCLWCLRDGMDLHSLRLLMGHSSLAVLQRYLALAGEDIERAHKPHSPVDNLLSAKA
jgi:site-specific recombinase XerD